MSFRFFQIIFLLLPDVLSCSLNYAVKINEASILPVSLMFYDNTIFFPSNTTQLNSRCVTTCMYQFLNYFIKSKFDLSSEWDCREVPACHC